MLAEIIAIGSELTCGSKLDTNSQWLSRELESLGWTVTRHTTLPDDLDAIAGEFRAASKRAQVVLITGGLGPTLDDITRDALAEAFDQPLVRDPESLKHIEALFAARGRPMPERNHCQADRPERSEALPNRCGTAPGILMKVPTGTDGPASESSVCLFAAMPGVPAEMRPMFEQQIRPQLLNSGMVLCRRVIRTFGFGESEAERLLGDLTARGRNPEVGITASEAVISLWVTARSKSSEEAQQICDEALGLIRQRLGESVYSESDAELHDVVAGLLKLRHQRIALMEGATTGGLLSLWLTESESLSAVVDRAIVIMGRWDPSDQIPSRQRTAPDPGSLKWIEVAKEIAERFLRDHPVDYLLLSSPFGDRTAETGVSVREGWVAVAGRGVFETFDVSMSGNLSIFRQRAARTALNQLRLLISRSQ
jgi:nicotinamide-nucleotide amidase